MKGYNGSPERGGEERSRVVESWDGTISHL